MKVLKEESKELVIEFDTRDLTIPDLIANELLSDSNTEFAGVSKDHPETGNAVLAIRSKKNAKSELLKAIERIDGHVTELKKSVQSRKK